MTKDELTNKLARLENQIYNITEEDKKRWLDIDLQITEIMQELGEVNKKGSTKTISELDLASRFINNKLLSEKYVSPIIEHLSNGLLGYKE